MIGWILLGAVAVPTVSVSLFLRTERFGAHPEGARLERVLKSPHQKDGVFRNLEPTEVMTDEGGWIGGAAEFLFKSHPGTVPDAPIPSVKPDLSRLDPAKDLLVWLGHSSYLLQVEGTRFLVDPVFSGRATPMPFGMSAFPGSDACTAQDMPAIDILLITHDHWDHLDMETVKRLRPKVGKVVCGLGVGAHLERWGYPPERIVEVDWGDSLALPRGLSLHAATARHFSGRGLRSGRSLWCSYVLKSPRRSLFLGGDGGYGKHLADIGAQYGPFDLAFVEQGQYNPGWRQIHLLPSQLSGTMHDLRATRLLPVHNSKFTLAYHRWSEPLDSAETTARRDGFTLLTPRIGEVLPLDSTPSTGRWWKAPVPPEPPPSRDR